MGRTPEEGAVQRRMEAAVKSGAVGRESPSGDRGIAPPSKAAIFSRVSCDSKRLRRQCRLLEKAAPRAGRMKQKFLLNYLLRDTKVYA
jgi:hypothetical protein